MVLNLLPILPLDGGRIAVSLLPNRLAYRFARSSRMALSILLVLLFTGVLGALLIAAVSRGMRCELIYTVFNSGLSSTPNVP